MRMHTIETHKIASRDQDLFAILDTSGRAANAVRASLQRRFQRTHVGVIMTDSQTTPLRVGVTGVALAYSGCQVRHDSVGTKDLSIVRYGGVVGGPCFCGGGCP